MDACLPWLPARGPSVDFFSRLPSELVLEVMLFLEADDVCQCLLTCRRWYELLSNMEPYWWRACVQIGLPEYQIGDLRTRFTSSKDLFFAGRKHRMSVSATPPRLVRLSAGYPVGLRYACQYARGRLVVGTVYKDFRPCEIVVERVDRLSVVKTNVFVPSFQRIAENRVVWGQLDSSFLLCATASGIWTGYNLRDNCCLFKWQGEPLYDSDLTIGCCGTCFLVCTAKLFSFRTPEDTSYWDLRIIRVRHAHQTSQVMRFKLPTGCSDVTPRRASCGLKKVCLVPLAGSHQDGCGFCQSHTVLLQWANCVAAYTLWTRGDSFTLSRRPFPQLTAPCRHLEEALLLSKYCGLNTTFCLSSDSQLIGLIFSATLHVWNLQSGEKLGSMGIALESYSYEKMRLIALGHVYSVVGLEFSNALLVVATRTGDVVLKCTGFAQNHGRMVPPYIEFLSAVHEDWLSSITCPCSAVMPTVVYWNKTNRSIEGITFGSLSAEWVEGEENLPTPVRKRGWWKWRRERLT